MSAALRARRRSYRSLHPWARRFASDARLSGPSASGKPLTVHFILHRLDDPPWGVRSAVKKHYERYPNWFVKRAKHEGVWRSFKGIGAIPGWQDLHFAHHGGPSSPSDVAFDRGNGIYSYYYDEPWDFWLQMPTGKHYSDEEAVAALKEHGMKRGPHREGAALASAMEDDKGQIIGHFTDVPWCYGGWLPVNVDPGLPPLIEGGLNAAQFSQQAYLKALAPEAQPQTVAVGWHPLGDGYHVVKEGMRGMPCLRIDHPVDGPGGRDGMEDGHGVAVALSPSVPGHRRACSGKHTHRGGERQRIFRLPEGSGIRTGGAVAEVPSAGTPSPAACWRGREAEQSLPPQPFRLHPSSGRGACESKIGMVSPELSYARRAHREAGLGLGRAPEQCALPRLARRPAPGLPRGRTNPCRPR